MKTEATTTAATTTMTPEGRSSEIESSSRRRRGEDRHPMRDLLRELPHRLPDGRPHPKAREARPGGGEGGGPGEQVDLALHLVPPLHRPLPRGRSGRWPSSPPSRRSTRRRVKVQRLGLRGDLRPARSGLWTDIRVPAVGGVHEAPARRRRSLGLRRRARPEGEDRLGPEAARARGSGIEEMKRIFELLRDDGREEGRV